VGVVFLLRMYLDVLGSRAFDKQYFQPRLLQVYGEKPQRNVSVQEAGPELATHRRLID